jgi:hypothetical protein
MPNLKVKPLEWYMSADLDELRDMGYTASDPVIGRDGYYCRGNVVWFEVDGAAYPAYPGFSRQRARESFCYNLTVNDEAILTDREVMAIKEILAVTRDSAIRQVLRKRLNLHHASKATRDSARSAKKMLIRIGL